MSVPAQNRFSLSVALVSVAALGIVFVFLVLPLVVIFREAFREGLSVWAQAVSESDALSAIKMTLAVTAIVVPVNTIFGVAAAWALAKFNFRGRDFIVSLIELPFTVSPVV